MLSVRTIHARCHWHTGLSIGKGAHSRWAECRQSSVQALSLNWLMVLMAEIQAQNTGMSVFFCIECLQLKLCDHSLFYSNSNLINCELKIIVSMTT
jgi:hypothetical protein